jgi:hypothetical protein
MNDVSAPAHADDFSLAKTHELEDGLNDDLRARVKNELEPGERLLWAGRHRLVNTCYAITDRRVIMWTPEPRGDAVGVQALGRGQIKSLVRIERPDGSGHLEFYGRFKFTYVPEVRRVEQIVRSNLMTSEPSV